MDVQHFYSDVSDLRMDLETTRNLCHALIHIDSEACVDGAAVNSAFSIVQARLDDSLKRLEDWESAFYERGCKVVELHE